MKRKDTGIDPGVEPACSLLALQLEHPVQDLARGTVAQIQGQRGEHRVIRPLAQGWERLLLFKAENGNYICSRVRMPSASRPPFSTCAVKSQSASRLARSAASAFSTGQFS